MRSIITASKLTRTVATVACVAAQLSVLTLRPRHARADMAPLVFPNMGGKIIPNAQVRVIFYGEDWVDPLKKSTYDEALDSVRTLFNDPHLYENLAGYYGSNGSVGPGRLHSVSIEPAHIENNSGGPQCSGRVRCATGLELQAAVQARVSLEPVDDDVVYLVLLPMGVGLVDAGVGESGSHGALPNGVPWGVAMTIPPDAVHARFGAGYGPAVHELVEMITDPNNDNQRTWWSQYGVAGPNTSEIGDICNDTFAYRLDGINTQSYVARDGYCHPYAQWPAFDRIVAAPFDPETHPVTPRAASFTVINEYYGQSRPSIFGLMTNNAVEYRDFGAAGWQPWRASPDPGWLSQIAAVSTARGNDLIGIGGDSRVWWKSAESIYDYWALASDFTARQIAIVEGGYYGAGSATLFAIATDGKVYYQSLDTKGAQPAPSGWLVLDGLPGAATQIAVGHAGNDIFAAAVVNDGWPVYLARQTVTTSFAGTRRLWQPWQTLDAASRTVIGSDLGYARVSQIVTGRTGVAVPGGERLALFAIVQSGSSRPRVFRAIDDPSDWSRIGASWVDAGFPDDTKQLSVTLNSNGWMELFAVGPFNRVLHAWQRSANDDDWSAPATLGGNLQNIQAFTWPNGCIDVFGVSVETQQVVHDWQSKTARGVVWQYDPNP